jgi:hypothetical protein
MSQLHFEFQAMIPSGEWPEEFDPMFQPEMQEAMDPADQDVV